MNSCKYALKYVAKPSLWDSGVYLISRGNVIIESKTSFFMYSLRNICLNTIFLLDLTNSGRLIGL